MAYKISDECIACGACESECPVEAISEQDGKMVIDADKCVECGACAGVCPVGAPAAVLFRAYKYLREADPILSHPLLDFMRI